ncbi:unnamed protein product [Miscanthus lutarioriparius]|uniref:Uncharacterized protein n=1 Tax=Miscanthus lutarioriparius TaxID=422564 RepID=A0A811MSQ7_9POAL|nr:unnamed protein product [Miscanthus lutarioriparius]
MQRRVEDSQNWAKIRSCLQDGEVELQVFRKELDRSESFTVSIPAHTGGAMPASSYSDQSLTEDDALLCLNTEKTRLSPQCTTSSKTATIGQSEEEASGLLVDLGAVGGDYRKKDAGHHLDPGCQPEIRCTCATSDERPSRRSSP